LKIITNPIKEVKKIFKTEANEVFLATTTVALATTFDKLAVILAVATPAGSV